MHVHYYCCWAISAVAASLWEMIDSLGLENKGMIVFCGMPNFMKEKITRFQSNAHTRSVGKLSVWTLYTNYMIYAAGGECYVYILLFIFLKTFFSNIDII